MSLVLLSLAAFAAPSLVDLELSRAPASQILATAGADASAGELARVARALGRVGSSDALPALGQLVIDARSEVREAAAWALGRVPGGEAVLLEALRAEPAASLAHATARAAMLRALGRAGGADAIPVLALAVGADGPDRAAAAEALGRLGVRKVEGVGAAAPALVGALGASDPRVVEAAAYGLVRVGAESVDPAGRATIVRRAHDAPSAAARAFLVRVGWKVSEPGARPALFARAVDDADALVRIAALQSVGPGEVPVTDVAALLDDRDAQVTVAAVAAVGRVGGENAAKILRSRAEGASGFAAGDAWQAAVQAGATLDAAVAEDASAHPEVRAIAVVGLPVDRLVRLATTDASARVRTAALAELSEREGDAVRVAPALLDAADPAARAVAVDLLRGAAEGRRAIAARLASETDVEVLAAGLDALKEVAAREVRDDTVRAVLAATASSTDRLVRARARALAAARGLSAPPFPGDPAPAVGDAAVIRSARLVTERGDVRLTLFPDVAPLAVASFAALAEADFYDGLVFHRVVPGFVVQAGCPRGDGWGGPGYALPDEVSDIPYERGSLGMASAGPDTAGSQWFVTLSPQPHLTGSYTLFGEVRHGMDVLRRVVRGDRILDVVIERVPEAR